MAAATTIISGALIAGGAAMSVSAAEKKRKEAKRMREEGQKGIDNFEWQDIENAIPIRTEGIQMLREENARMSATAMDALRSGGTRGLGAVADLVGYGNQMNQQARVALENQYIRRDYTRLGMMEKRQADELAGYGQLMNVGMQMEHQARADLANSITGAGYSLMGVGSMDDVGDSDDRRQRRQERRAERKERRAERRANKSSTAYGGGVDPWDIYYGGYTLYS